MVDTDSQLITAVDVLPGNAPDNLGVLELVEQSEASTGSVVEEAMGDAAYGDGGTRQAFADAGRRLVAKVPGRPNRKHFPKHDFHLDLAAGSCACPAGQVTRTIVPAGNGRTARVTSIDFRPSSSTGPNVGYVHCAPSASRPKAVKDRGCKSIPRKPCCSRPERCSRARPTTSIERDGWWAEHRLARLVQLGIRQSRYFGRVKTRFQLYLAATVANLTLVLGKIGLLGSTGSGATSDRVVLNVVYAVVAGAAANFSAIRLGQLWSLILLTSALLPKSLYPTRAFRPGF